MLLGGGVQFLLFLVVLDAELSKVLIELTILGLELVVFGLVVAYL